MTTLRLEATGEAAIAAVAPSPELRLEAGGRAVLGGIYVPEEEARAARLLLAERLRTTELRTAMPPASDRWGRLVVVRGIVGGADLQAVLVEAGLALVRPWPGTDEELSDLLLLEAQAREAGRGLWHQSETFLLPAEDAAAGIGRFVVVEGRVLQASQQQRYFYLNFGRSWRTDTTARIDRPTLAVMRAQGFEPEALEGRRVRLRGALFEENGPMLELWTHHGIEVLP